MRGKSEREEAIKTLLLNHVVTDQKELVLLLAQLYGIVTNQAVVSRDLHRLGVVKKKLGESLVYTLPETDVETEILQLALISVAYNESLIVIKTHPGLAAFVGDYLDRCSDLDILGCLAGENVVFVTPKSIGSIQEVCTSICARLHFKKDNNNV